MAWFASFAIEDRCLFLVLGCWLRIRVHPWNPRQRRIHEIRVEQVRAGECDSPLRGWRGSGFGGVWPAEVRREALQGVRRSYTGWDMVGNEENTVGLVETRTIRVVEQDKPLLLDCGKKLGPIDVAYETYGQLNQAGRQRYPHLPRAERQRPRGRLPQPGRQQARLVGYHGRARQRHRHEQVLRDLLQLPWRLHGHDRPVVHQS